MTGFDFAANGTFASASSGPAPTFDDLANLVRELTKEPVLKEVRVHPSAYDVLRAWLDRASAHRGLTFAGMDRVQTFGIYGAPVRIDQKLKPGQWRAIDGGEGYAGRGTCSADGRRRAAGKPPAAPC